MTFDSGMPTMKATPQTADQLKKFQRRARACALISQLPDDDMDAAREVVRDFLAMAEEAGLLQDRQPVLFSVVEGGDGGNSPRRRAIPIDNPSMAPE